ncbi:MAG: phosphoribosylamine--glycine ligase, partial [Candidatus Marinimicrobia bacterium]|nr:phosphoribosylamine--glycine ligase [Candidatus Neomarinimicrobiota bacterium]
MVNKILIIGSGAREHAIVRALDRSPQKKELYCLASNMNPGIAEICDELTVGRISDPDFVVNYAQETAATLAIIGPENPLENGVADALWKLGVKTVGPKQKLARLETSKAFTRDLLKEYAIPGGPKYQIFDSMVGVAEFLKELKENYVVKYDGLMGGKGVKVSGDHLHSH